jgi:hypothetical protein
VVAVIKNSLQKKKKKEMTLFSLLPKFWKAFLELERRKDPTPLGHKILFSKKMDNENFV